MGVLLFSSFDSGVSSAGSQADLSVFDDFDSCDASSTNPELSSCAEDDAVSEHDACDAFMLEPDCDDDSGDSFYVRLFMAL